MPHQSFLELISLAKEDDLFKAWTKIELSVKEPSPIELLVLSASRHLGRGWTFDDVSESTGILEETYRRFFHVFICGEQQTCFQSMQ